MEIKLFLFICMGENLNFQKEGRKPRTFSNDFFQCFSMFGGGGGGEFSWNVSVGEF